MDLEAIVYSTGEGSWYRSNWKGIFNPIRSKVDIVVPSIDLYILKTLKGFRRHLIRIMEKEPQQITKWGNEIKVSF